MKFRKIVFTLMSLVLLSSCGNYIDQKATPSESLLLNESGATVYYATVNNAIFIPRCVSCHENYKTYEGVFRGLTAIQEAVTAGRMPKDGGPLTNTQKEILATWIENGAPEEAGKTAEPDQLQPNWKSISELLIAPKCLVCHNPNGQGKMVDLSSRQVIYSNRNRIFLGEFKFINLEIPADSYILQIINDEEEPMPPLDSNIPRLNKKEVEILTQWLELGLP